MLRITPLEVAPCPPASPAAAPHAAADAPPAIPDGMWGLAWQEALRRMAAHG
jgi:hypothetical protein